MRKATGLAALALLAGCNGGESGGDNIAVPAPTPTAAVSGAAAPAGSAWVDKVEQTAEGGFRMGNPDAAIKLIEYGSRTCGHCAAFAATGLDGLKKYVATGKVSFEFRDFLLNPIDLGAALAGQCGGPAPFFTILDQMYAQQAETMKRMPAQNDPFLKEIEALPQQQQIVALAERFGYVDFVKERGVPEAQVRQCLADPARTQALGQRNEAATKQYNIPGTPTFILNGKVLENTGTWPHVEAALKAAGA
jgi:protein-disulfide isomerase